MKTKLLKTIAALGLVGAFMMAGTASASGYGYGYQGHGSDHYHDHNGHTYHPGHNQFIW